MYSGTRNSALQLIPGHAGRAHKKRPWIKAFSVFPASLNIFEIQVCKPFFRGLQGAVWGEAGVLEIFLVFFRDHLGSFFINDVVHHFPENVPEGLKVLFVEVDLVFFVMEGSVFVSEFLTLGNRQVVVSGLGASYIEEIGPSTRPKYFGMYLLLVHQIFITHSLAAV